MKTRVLISAIVALLALIFGAESADGATQPEAAGSEENKSITALDYTAPLGDLANFFKSRRAEATAIYNEWAVTGSDEMRKIERASTAVTEIEDNIRERTYADYRTYSENIVEQLIALDAERSKARAVITEMAAGQAKTIERLREMEKQDNKAIADVFKGVMKNITPKTQLPAESTWKVNVNFSQKPELKDYPGYLDPLNEMIMWFWNAEQALYGMIDAWNPRIESRKEEDAVLSSRIDELNAQLSEYNGKDPKVHKEAITAIKKQISQVDKERKAVAKAMAADAKELGNVIKTFNSDILAAYKERLNHAIIEMTYFMAERIHY